jgi:HlyD family secretion protein
VRRAYWVGGGLLGVVLLAAAAKPAGWLDFLRSSGEGGDAFTVHPTSLMVSLKEDGELKPVKSVDIKCEVQSQGLTLEWVVAESTHVKEGDPLFRLAADEFRDRVETEELELGKLRGALEEARQALSITQSENASKLDKCRSDLEIAKLELQRYRDGEFSKSEQTIAISIKQTETELTRATDELTKSRPLVERNFISKTKLKEMEDEVERLDLTLKKQNLELEILRKYEYEKSMLEKRSAVKQAEDELERETARAASREQQAQAKVRDQEESLSVREKRFERIREQLAKTAVVAPVEGIVRYGGGENGGWRWNGNRIAAGEQVFQGQTLITIPDTSKMMVTTRVHEADRHKIREGLACLIKVPAVPGRTFTGRIDKIAKFADSERSWLNPNLKEHATDILLDDTDAPLSPGDTAQIEILIEEVADVLAVPVQCIFSRGARHFVFVRHGLGQAEPVEVKLGRSTTAMIEVCEGLRAGDEVLMAAEERLLAQLPAPATSQPAGMPAGDTPPARRGGGGGGRSGGPRA